MTALYSLSNLFFFKNSVSSGTLDLDSTGNSSITHIPVVTTTLVLHGVNALINTRHQQLEVINSSGSFKAVSDNSIFSGLDDNLDWFQKTDNPLELLQNYNLNAGLLNPLMLITPLIQLQQNNLNASNAVTFNSLAYDPANKKAEMQINLSQPKRGNQIMFDTANFNAYELGFTYSQISQASSTNIKLPAAAGIVNNFSMFMTSPCISDEYEKQDAQQCNQPTIISGHKFAIEQLPATANFKLWKQQPESEETPEDFNFIIKIEDSF